MENLRHILGENPKYKGLKKPLEAASVCDAARALGKDRFGVVSFRQGLLCLSAESSAQAADLQMKNQEIIDSINDKLGRKVVERIRIKIV